MQKKPHSRTTRWPDSAAYALNTRKINATSNQSVNKGKKSSGGEACETRGEGGGADDGAQHKRLW